ncbi:multidrug resistance efflux pump [Paraburkholderia sp. JPY681]|nr:multidrug resistance efflux pump [Paraburkholderia atlantica]
MNLAVFGCDYATAGAAKLAIVDSHSFWVYGYFEEAGCRTCASAIRPKYLAQRVPVRVKIDSMPADVMPATGMTCTVVVRPGTGLGSHRAAFYSRNCPTIAFSPRA